MEIKPSFYKTEHELLETRFEIRVNNGLYQSQRIEPTKLYTDSLIDIMFNQAKEEMKKLIRNDRKNKQ